MSEECPICKGNKIIRVRTNEQSKKTGGPEYVPCPECSEYARIQKMENWAHIVHDALSEPSNLADVGVLGFVEGNCYFVLAKPQVQLYEFWDKERLIVLKHKIDLILKEME